MPERDATHRSLRSAKLLTAVLPRSRQSYRHIYTPVLNRAAISQLTQKSAPTHVRRGPRQPPNSLRGEDLNPGTSPGAAALAVYSAAILLTTTPGVHAPIGLSTVTSAVASHWGSLSLGFPNWPGWSSSLGLFMDLHHRLTPRASSLRRF